MKPYTLHNTGYNGSVIHAVSFKNKIRAYCISTAKLDPTVYFVWQIHFTRRWILSYKSVAVFTISLCSEYVKTDMKILTQRCTSALYQLKIQREDNSWSISWSREVIHVRETYYFFIDFRNSSWWNWCHKYFFCHTKLV